MEIKELKIFSINLDAQEDFYKSVLGFPCSRPSKSILEIQSGQTKLILEASPEKFFYHFAFLIPTGSLNSAIDFLEQKSIELLPLNGKKIIQFDSGRAIYFYDKDGNIGEFIERPSLNYPPENQFSIDKIIRINEIGLPVSDPIKMSNSLISEHGIHPIKNAPFYDRFCWVGDHQGAIIVIKEGRNWLPTLKTGIINDFSISYVDQGTTHRLTFQQNKLQEWS